MSTGQHEELDCLTCGACCRTGHDGRILIPPEDLLRWRSLGREDIARAILYLRSLGSIAIVLVEQYLDFACELGDNFAVMDRGAVKYACDRASLDPAEISRQMAL